jgi:hypothetical protein
MVYVFYDAERFDAREYPIGRKPLEPGSFAPVTEYSISASIMPYTRGETFTNLSQHIFKVLFPAQLVPGTLYRSPPDPAKAAFRPRQ